jgi:DNA (cytosine-5)-methyltransferase 1
LYKVADFFCGGGGFSEGFKLAGFEVVFAVDKWQPAVITHRANHPNANTYCGDVLDISNLPDNEFHKLIPDTEIIIGSPPCTFFSSSNKSGKADKSEGIQLIKAYLKIVARKLTKKNSILKYWVLENVPNASLYIKDAYNYRELGLDYNGKLQVKYPSSKVYNAKYFGVASNRKRFFCGNFIEPKPLIKESGNGISVNEILKNLKEPNFNLNMNTVDPNFNDFVMQSKNITDHHYIAEIARFEWEKAKRHKQDKGYMGKMAFPEDLNKPSRTIMATMSTSSRESLIYPYIPEEKRYRLPTVREIACIMSYPLDYRFYGKSKGIKYKLVGNSVPPKMAFAIAKAIATHNGLNVPKKYTPISFSNETTKKFFNLNFKTFPLNKEKRKKENTKFKYHIPYLKINTFRVELSNQYLTNSKFEWLATIHKGQGAKAKRMMPDIDMKKIITEDQDSINEFIKALKCQLPNADEFQKYYCMTTEERKQNNIIGPYELLSKIRNFIDSKYDLNNPRTILYNTENYPYPIYVGYVILKKITEHINKKA